MTLYREWTQRPNLRKGLMVTQPGLDVLMRGRDAGYCSVYMFSEADAKEIEARHHSKGLERYEVYSDCVFIDIDGSNSDLELCLNALVSLGLDHSVYYSGSKGYHVLVPLTETVCGKNVPYSQRKWVESLGINFDPSIYRAGALISLPGRVHPKTGVKKTLKSIHNGKPLELPLLEPVAAKAFNLGDDEDALKRGLTQLTSLILNPPDEGNRHISIWKVAKSLAEAGLSHSTALEILSRINESWECPKDAASLASAIEGAYA